MHHSPPKILQQPEFPSEEVCVLMNLGPLEKLATEGKHDYDLVLCRSEMPSLEQKVL